MGSSLVWGGKGSAQKMLGPQLVSGNGSAGGQNTALSQSVGRGLLAEGDGTIFV